MKLQIKVINSSTLESNTIKRTFATEEAANKTKVEIQKYLETTSQINVIETKKGLQIMCSAGVYERICITATRLITIL